ncbi:MAG: amino acid decarboxylase [Acidobacteria bacterium]|nr:amino acid decarboxylase [Acidobacteriota bacterium]
MTFGDISIEQFRSQGEQVFNWISEYFQNLDDIPVTTPVSPQELRKRLKCALPEKAEPLEMIFRDFKERVVPYLTHWNHPRFFAYFPNTGSGPGILAETLAAALNVNLMKWSTAPSACALEEVVLDWVKQMVDYPFDSEGILTNGASLGSLFAMAAALHQVPGLDLRNKGLSGRSLPVFRVYQSEEAHSSLDRAALTLGIGLDNVVKVPVDTEYRLRPQHLEASIRKDRERGHLPFFVCATVGTTSTTSVDPLETIAAICRQEKLWLHVDASYAGFAKIVPELSPVVGDLSVADSLIVNPHKWLFNPMEISCLLWKPKGAFTQTFSLVPEYLRSPEDGGTDFMNLTPQLGRSFRALKLWYVIRSFGMEGLRERLREHVRLARWFADRVDEDPSFERLAPVPFSTVCFRVRSRDPNQFNTRLLQNLNRTGEIFLSDTKLRGNVALRFSVGNIRTEQKHVEDAWRLIKREASGIAHG